jgi:hypothetical protein
MFVSPRLTAHNLAEIYESEDFCDTSVLDNFDPDQWMQQTGDVIHALSSYKVKAILLDLVAKYVPPGGRSRISHDDFSRQSLQTFQAAWEILFLIEGDDRHREWLGLLRDLSAPGLGV